jgi:hypothetical protein
MPTPGGSIPRLTKLATSSALQIEKARLLYIHHHADDDPIEKVAVPFPVKTWLTTGIYFERALRFDRLQPAVI